MGGLAEKLSIDAKRVSSHLNDRISERSVRYYQLPWFTELTTDAIESIWSELEKFLA